MPQVIDIPGVGPVEFPDSMAEGDITTAARRLHTEAVTAERRQRILPGQPSVAAAAPVPAPASVPQQTTASKALNFVGDLPRGLAKGALSTVYNGGDLIRRATGMERIIEDPDIQAAMSARTPGEKTGKFVEQMAEFAIPGGAAAKATKGLGVLTRAGAQAATAGAVGVAQEGDINAGLVPAVVAGAMPVVGAGLAAAGRSMVRRGATSIPKTARGGDSPDVLTDAILTENIGLSRSGAAKARREMSSLIAELDQTINNASIVPASGGAPGVQPYRAVTMDELVARIPALEAEIAKGALGRNDPALRMVRALAEKLKTRQLQPDQQQVEQLFTLAETQALKKAEQATANQLYRAQTSGQVIPPSARTRAQFAKAVAHGAREAIEARLPDTARINQQLQRLGTIKDAGDYIADRRPSGGVLSMLGRLIGGPSPATRYGRVLHNPIAGNITRPGAAGTAAGGQVNFDELVELLMQRETSKTGGQR